MLAGIFQKFGDIFYSEGEFYDEPQPSFTRTWSNSSSLPGVSSAQLYTGGKSMLECAPPAHKVAFKEHSSRLKAHIRALQIAKVEMSNRSVLQIFPEIFLKEFLRLQNIITEHVFSTHEKPENYDFLEELYFLIQKIKKQRLNLDVSALKKELHARPAREFWKTVQKISPHISYDMFKTKTGRLTTCRGSFPIMTMAKKYRGILKPQNDCLVELDYNAAELRVFLALSGKEQPEQDLHEWNGKHVYKGLTNREQSKKRIFAWLYNPQSRDHQSEKFYKKRFVVDSHYKNGIISTPYGREIPADDFHALNYLIQSTASDVTLAAAIEVDKYLSENCEKSFISFMIHDSLVLDVTKEELRHIKEIQRIFETTKFGKFMSNVQIGRDYGNLVGCNARL